MFKKKKIALVLAGGGAKSLCQIGVLKALQREKIPIDLVVGCSMGAVVGALLSLGFTAEKIEEMTLKFCQLKQVRDVEKKFSREGKGIRKIGEFMRELSLYLIDWLKEGIWREEDLMKGLQYFIPHNLTFHQTHIPFVCVATEIKEGKRVILKEGNLLSAVVASSTIPGLFTPVREGEKTLVDGGVLSKIPVMAAEKMGADFIIAISSGNLTPKEPSRAIEILIRMNEIRDWELSRIETQLADFLFSPSVEKWQWFSFSQAKAIIKEGEKEGERKIHYLKTLLKKSNREKRNLRKSLLPLFYS